MIQKPNDGRTSWSMDYSSVQHRRCVVETTGSGTLMHGQPNNWDFQDYAQSRPFDPVITYSYTPTGKVDTMFYPQIDVATWYNYTPRKWLDTLVATNGVVDLFRQELTYDAAGYITKQYSIHDGAAPLTQVYGYDNIGQLTSWAMNPLDPINGTVQLYSYDYVGNRLSTTDYLGDPSTFQGSGQYTIGPNLQSPLAGPNQLTRLEDYDATSTLIGSTDFVYDPDGSMTTRTQNDGFGMPMMEDRYSYSSWRGLTTGFEREDLLGPPPPAPSLIFSSEYRYNAMGEREQKRETANPAGSATLPGYSWTYYLLNGTKEQLSVWNGAEAASTGTCSWLTGQNVYLWPEEYLVYAVEYPGIREDIPRLSLTPDGTPEYRVTDHLASVRQTLDEGGSVVNQVDYEPFGAVLSSYAVERQGFNSREHDGEDGLSNNGVRKLDEGLGRFVAVDPLWASYEPWSPYQYGFNSPLLVVDPNGMQGRGVQVYMTAEYRSTSSDGTPAGAGGQAPPTGTATAAASGAVGAAAPTAADVVASRLRDVAPMAAADGVDPMSHPAMNAVHAGLTFALTRTGAGKSVWRATASSSTAALRGVRAKFNIPQSASPVATRKVSVRVWKVNEKGEGKWVTKSYTQYHYRVTKDGKTRNVVISHHPRDGNHPSAHWEGGEAIMKGGNIVTSSSGAWRYSNTEKVKVDY